MPAGKLPRDLARVPCLFRHLAQGRLGGVLAVLWLALGEGPGIAIEVACGLTQKHLPPAVDQDAAVGH